MKITMNTLQRAFAAARRIEEIENAEEFQEGRCFSASGGAIEIPITRQMFDEARREQLSNGHAYLASLGFELLAPEGSK